jgi:PleD family two-component response regulator
LGFNCNGKESGATFSIGEAATDGTESPEEVLPQACKKLYEEKASEKIFKVC